MSAADGTHRHVKNDLAPSAGDGAGVIPSAKRANMKLESERSLAAKGLTDGVRHKTLTHLPFRAMSFYRKLFMECLDRDLPVLPKKDAVPHKVALMVNY